MQHRFHDEGFASRKRFLCRISALSATMVALALLIGCAESSPTMIVKLDYQPPVIPLLVSIDTSGKISLSLTISDRDWKVPTPIGTFRPGIEASLPSQVTEKASTLTIRFDDLDHVYDLRGQDFDIQFQAGYYEEVSISKIGPHVLLELRRAQMPPAAADKPNRSTPTRAADVQPIDNPEVDKPSPTPLPRVTPSPAQNPPSVPPPPAPQPVTRTCSINVDYRFQAVWERAGGTAAGCPQGQAYTRRITYQPFQNGFMYWVASPSGDAGGMIYVLYNSGAWQEYRDNWVEGMAERADYSPPAGFFEPRRGFGNRWQQLGGPGAAIGWALQDEIGADFGLIQIFPNNAVILQFPEQSLILLPDGKRWVR